MVKYWIEQREKAIKLTKMRIRHLEKHGDGDSAMREKQNLVRQERHNKLRADEGL